MTETVVLQNLTIGYTAKGNRKVVASDLNATIKSGEPDLPAGAERYWQVYAVENPFCFSAQVRRKCTGAWARDSRLY